MFWIVSAPKSSLTALYVRIPEAQSKRIESLATELGQSKQQVVTGILGSGLSESTDQLEMPTTSDVLTLQQAAALLGVATEAVEDAVRKQGLPGRLIGNEWRFARQALLAWLSTPDPSIKTQTGFTSRAAK